MQTKNEDIQTDNKWMRRGGTFALFIYLLTLFYTTLFIYNYYPYGKSVNLVLFDSIKLMWESGSYWLIIKNIIGNVLLFMPLGFLVPLVHRKCRSVIVITLIGLLISTSIELLQYLAAQRIFDIDDILLNGFGAVVGYGVYKICFFFYKKLKRK
ncbi:VanZ family protein [Alkalihalobacillus sp. CinArs1]|uniref:VanZ family protein n=1 Tax=Alkalihalobacillus sp. CinArs1 TaxID=2995314 RepID=UPI0022DD162B|nr:VanZ family protein [Alkalihalobacillus sp. CinArs1]